MVRSRRHPDTRSMRLRPCTYPLAALASVALLWTSACSSAPAKATASTGNTHLTAYTDNDGPTSTVILAGAVGDYGKAQSVNPDGSVNADHSGQLELTLAHGTFRLDIAGLDKRLVTGLAHVPVNPATCSATASVTGPVPVVAGSGSGSYQGIHGTFMLTVTLDEVYQPGGCSESSPYLAQAIVITGPGTVTIG
jgi:hypothetical protein